MNKTIRPHPLDTENQRHIEVYGSLLKEVGGKNVIDKGDMAKHERFLSVIDAHEWQIITALNYSDAMFVLHGDVYRELMTEEVRRLHCIRQLGTTELNVLMAGLNQTRFDHSVLVAALADSVLTEKGFSQDIVNLGIAAGILHDVAMPPYSEQGKLACLEELSEENNAELVISESDHLNRVMKKYNIKGKDVVACIRGEYPLVGPLINSRGIDLDRIAYLSRDVHNFVNLTVEFSVGSNKEIVDTESFMEFVESVKKMKGILAKRPKLFNIYRQIEFVKDGIAFKDKEYVADFLLLRALMFKDVYRNSFNNAKEAFFERELRKLWGVGLLNKENMLSMTDEQFVDKIRPHLSNRIYTALFDVFHESPFRRIERLYSKTEDEVRDDLARKGELSDDVIVKKQRKYGSGVKVRVMHKGEAVRFDELMPKQAEEIQGIVDRMEHVSVYKLV